MEVPLLKSTPQRQPASKSDDQAVAKKAPRPRATSPTDKEESYAHDEFEEVVFRPRKGEQNNDVRTGIKVTVVAVGLKSLICELRDYDKKQYAGDFNKVLLSDTR